MTGLADIRIYIAAHKQTFVPEHPWFYPLQIGTALNKPLDGFLHDNSGEHISEKNKTYCELTGQYWAWKNEQADYYGFYHYRRYFSFKQEKYPYVIYQYPDAATMDFMRCEPGFMEAFITRYDIIVPVAEDMHETAWQNYSRAPQHYMEDLKLAARIVKKQHPDYADAVDTYLGGTKLYLKNMYIMKHDLFYQYCSWLFPILEEFDQRNNWTKYNGNSAAMRVDGYLAERLFGIWYTRLKQNEDIKSAELSRVHFAGIDGGKGGLQKMKLVNAILPPGTKRRSIVSRWARFILKKIK